MGYMLAQQDPETKYEKAVYYISKKMLEYEQKYTVLDLVWATRRLRHYLLSHKVLLLSRMDPLKYLFEKPALTCRTTRWLLLLSEYDITHVTQKSVKGRAIAEQLAESPREESQPFEPMFPDEELMMIEDEYPEAEYEACIVGLEAALALGIEDLDVYGDSKLIICQTQGSSAGSEELEKRKTVTNGEKSFMKNDL
ncbi:uncharacterized protein LOC143888570 [Tasmannia lanceolata]|uniref:uncharacterized protein LOC143888570 n=1 Tax=Tasmannia lanceolata TaxID=3420 RepID=UPI004062EB91